MNICNFARFQKSKLLGEVAECVGRTVCTEKYCTHCESQKPWKFIDNILIFSLLLFRRKNKCSEWLQAG